MPDRACPVPDTGSGMTVDMFNCRSNKNHIEASFASNFGEKADMGNQNAILLICIADSVDVKVSTYKE